MPTKKTTKSKTAERKNARKKAPAKKKKTPIKKKPVVEAVDVPMEKDPEVVDIFGEAPEMNTDIFQESIAQEIEQPQSAKERKQKQKQKKMEREETQDDERRPRKHGRCTCGPRVHFGRFFLGLVLIGAGFVHLLQTTGWLNGPTFSVDLWGWWPILLVLVGVSFLPARGWFARTVAVLTILATVVVVAWVAAFGWTSGDDQKKAAGALQVEVTWGEEGAVEAEEMDKEAVEEPVVEEELDEELSEVESLELYTNSTTYELQTEDGQAVLYDENGVLTGFTVDNTLEDGTVIPTAVVFSADETQIAYNYYSSFTDEMTIATASVDGTGSTDIFTANAEDAVGGIVLNSLTWGDDDTSLQYDEFSPACELYCQSVDDIDETLTTYTVDIATGEKTEALDASSEDVE